MAIQLFTRSVEVKLMQMLREVRDQPAGWQAIHFHLSDLVEQYKNEYQVKIALNLINDLLKDYEGGIFLLSDSGIIVLCYGLEKTIHDKLIFQLRYLYMDDTLAYAENGQENPAFSTSYDLKRNGQEFLDLCSRRMAKSVRKSLLPDAAEREPVEFIKPPPKVELPVRRREKEDFSASRLAIIEQDLYHADLNRVLRRQPVCVVFPKMTVRRVFDELYIHIAHLRQMLKTDIDFLSDRWLFKYLTRILDQRMIDLIRSHPSRYLESPISLNLNVETLLSSWFDEFDAAIKPAAKVSIVIEVPVIDVFADMAAFTLARTQVQKLGYRVCLDGLTTASFVSINRERLGLDLIKVQWNADVQGDLTSRENIELSAAVREAGTNRVILCRCDDRAAIEYGQVLGISLFQGRYLDGLLDPTAKITN